jgi:hypothetical protein
MCRAGYDPREMPHVFEMLGRVSGAQDGGRLPQWLVTHPDPENNDATLRGTIVWLEYRGAIYRLVAYALAGQWMRYRATAERVHRERPAAPARLAARLGGARAPQSGGAEHAARGRPAGEVGGGQAAAVSAVSGSGRDEWLPAGARG